MFGHLISNIIEHCWGMGAKKHLDITSVLQQAFKNAENFVGLWKIPLKSTKTIISKNNKATFAQQYWLLDQQLILFVCFSNPLQEG